MSRYKEKMKDLEKEMNQATRCIISIEQSIEDNNTCNLHKYLELYDNCSRRILILKMEIDSTKEGHYIPKGKTWCQDNYCFICDESSKWVYDRT